MWHHWLHCGLVYNTSVAALSRPTVLFGPILFLLYTADMMQLTERSHLYANDMQTRRCLLTVATAQHEQQVSVCINDVAKWMQSK